MTYRETESQRIMTSSTGTSDVSQGHIFSDATVVPQ